jgi:hypothetical protein
MTGVHYRFPVSIYYIRSVKRDQTTVTAGANSTTQHFASTSWMFEGQKLSFKIADVIVSIVSIDSPTQVTLDHVVASTTGEVVRESMVQQRCEMKMHALLEVLKDWSTGGFQCPDLPSIDCSETNPGNQVFYIGNTGMYAGLLTANLLGGDGY